MSLPILIGSLAAVFFVAAVSWFLGMGRTPRIESGDQARQLACDAHSGFEPTDAVVSRDGKAALVSGRNGDFVLLREHGANIAARVMHEQPPIRQDGNMLIVETGERLYGDLRLDLGAEDARRWSGTFEIGTTQAAHG